MSDLIRLKVRVEYEYDVDPADYPVDTTLQGLCEIEHRHFAEVRDPWIPDAERVALTVSLA